MVSILKTKTNSWPIQINILAMALFISIFGLMIQYAPAVYNYWYYSVSNFTFSENTKRITLINKTVKDPSILSSLTEDEMRLVLLEPAMVRTENDVKALHYYGESCAIDIYFNGLESKPDYIEFRALTLNQTVQDQFQDADQATVNQYCLKAVLAAQGDETPSSYAQRPMPSWRSPYSSS